MRLVTVPLSYVYVRAIVPGHVRRRAAEGCDDFAHSNLLWTLAGHQTIDHDFVLKLVTERCED